MFACEIGESHRFSVSYQNDEVIAASRIGHDRHAIYGLFVALAPLPGCPRNEMELVFHVTRDTGGDVKAFYDGAATQAFIPASSDRDKILMLLLEMVRASINVIQPKKVILNTHSPELPEKALRKYDLIAKMLMQCGYMAGRGDAYHGRKQWMMELLD
jgi:hypothetical protein